MTYSNINNICINSTPINDDKTSENVRGNASEAHVPPIDSEYEFFLNKYGK